MWNLVLVHLEIVLVSLKDRCTVCAKRPIGSEIVWTHPMVLILMQDRCTVCAEHTIGSEIVLDTHDGTPR